MDAYSFIVYIKTDDFDKGIVEDVAATILDKIIEIK